MEEWGTSCVNNQRPVADAGSDREGVVGEPLVFNGGTSYDPDGRELIKYYWTFGNGLTRTAIVASTVYDRAGTYTVTLTVTDVCRARTTDSITVTIRDNGLDPCLDNQAPVANAGADRTADVGEVLSFSGAASVDPENPTTLEYEWDFGDGALATGKTPTHQFDAEGDYAVTLYVTDDCGEESHDSLLARVRSACSGNLAPTANAGSTFRTVDTGVPVTFDGTASRDPENRALTYRWLFPNGQTANTQIASYTFTAEGSFPVRLTVTDPCGLTGFAIVSVAARNPVVEPPADELTAEFTISPAAPRVQQSVTFTAAAADRSEDLWFHWNFGDGVAGYGGPVVTRSFTSPGVFNVTLTVMVDVTWESRNKTKPITVDAGLSLVGTVLVDPRGDIVHPAGLTIVNGYVWTNGTPGRLTTADARGNGTPVFLKAQTLYGSMADIASSATLVAVTAGYGGVYLFNANDPTNQTLAGQYSTYNTDEFEAYGVALKGSTMYVTGGWSGLRVIDVSTPSSPRLIRSITNIGAAKHAALDGNRLYVVDGSLPGLRVFDVTQATQPVAIGSIPTYRVPLRFAVKDSLVAVAEAVNGVEFIDASNLSAPRTLSRVLDGGNVFGVALTDGFAYVTFGSAVIELDMSNRAAPRILTVVPTGYQGGAVRVAGGRIYATFGRSIVAVFEP